MYTSVYFCVCLFCPIIVCLIFILFMCLMPVPFLIREEDREVLHSGGWRGKSLVEVGRGEPRSKYIVQTLISSFKKKNTCNTSYLGYYTNHVFINSSILTVNDL